MNARGSSIATLAGVVVFAGIFQLLAIVRLGFASAAQVSAATRAGPLAYLLGACFVLIVAIAAHVQQARPGRAIATFLGGLALAYLALRTRVNSLGLVFYGEYMLHHFIALAAACACVIASLGWARDPELGRLRTAPLAVASLACLALLTLHVLEATGAALPEAIAGPLRATSTALGLCAWLVPLALFWRQLHPTRLRALAALIGAVVLVRFGLGGPSALLGAPLPIEGALPLSIAITIGGLGIAALAWVSSAGWTRRVAYVIAGAPVAILLELYYKRFGQIDEHLDIVARSLLGFEVPYPGALASWALGGVFLALFLTLLTIVKALLSARQRDRGVALALLMITGLGLGNPQLVLMHALAMTLLLDTLRQGPEDARRKGPPAPLEATLAQLSAELGLPEPVNLEQPDMTILAVRGELHDANVDLRARSPDGARWSIRLEVGVVGRGAAPLELRPDPNAIPGQHHPLVTTAHRIRGDARRLEAVDEDVLEALAHFPDHHARFWDAGARVDLGDDLSQLTPEALGDLTRALAKLC
ncbi:MAG: hypothetical protein KC636_07335 [Myxococcales bacterium]|nr:hypothetical protein [Myxococcales bacterium]